MKESKEIRLGLRMSQSDMEWLDVARRIMGYRSRAQLVRALVQMVVSPVRAEALKRGVTIDEVLKTLDPSQL